MLGIGQRIKDARRRAGMTQQALADGCGVSRAAVAQWEAGVTQPSLAHLGRAAAELGVWVSWLAGETAAGAGTGAPAPRPRGRTVPVVDYVRAGDWDTVTDPYPAGLGFDSLTTDEDVGPSTFALVIRGSSMEPAFRENDKIIVDPDAVPRPGDLVIAKLDPEEEATFKKYRPRGTDEGGEPVIELVPLNEDWPTLTISAANPGRIIGTVVEHRRYPRR